MELRAANMDDLPRLKAVYEKIIERMEHDGIPIWDDVYPCACFASDIEKKELYVLTEQEEITAAFALCPSHAGAEHVKWESGQAQALYLDRLGVNVKYARKGVGSAALRRAIALAREKGARCLRLFAVDFNDPAVNLYVKNGFRRAAGIYDEVVDDDLTLHEFGFEIEI